VNDFEQGVDLETRGRALLGQARDAYQRGFDARSLDALHALIRLNVADGHFAEAQWLMQYVPDYLRDHPDGPLVSVAPDVLGRGVALDGNDVEEVAGAGAFTVIARKPERAAAVLASVSERLMRVDETGHTLAPGELPAEDVYTPNFVFDVEICQFGAMVKLDTKGVMFSAMGRTMVAIIVDALTKERLPAHVTGYRPELRSEFRDWERSG